MTLQYHRFPALVTTSDGTVEDRAAVVVIDHVARLAVQRRNDVFDGGSPVTVIATLENVTGIEVGRQATLTGADGQTWKVEQGGGCGCRSPLSQWLSEQIQGQPAEL